VWDALRLREVASWPCVEDPNFVSTEPLQIWLLGKVRIWGAAVPCPDPGQAG